MANKNLTKGRMMINYNKKHIKNLSRKKLYLILFLHLTMFISCSTNKQYIGKVNNEPIKTDSYINLFMNNLDNFYREFNNTPDDRERKRIADETWQRFIDGYIMVDLYNKNRIEPTSPREVIDTLRTNIPIQILNSPRFRNENLEFDFESYYSSLIDDSPENLIWLKNFYQSTYIPQKKLQKKILSQRTFSEKEIKNFYDTRYSIAEIELYSFNVNDLDRKAITVSDKEIEDYYNANRMSFFVDTIVDVNWVSFKIKPSEKDVLNAEKIADSLYIEIKRGMSFNNLASLYSSQPFARLQGIMGYMEYSDFPHFIAEKLMNSDVGDILQPIFYDNSWWLYKVEAKTPNMIKPNIIKIDIKISRETIDENRNKMSSFIELSNLIGFNRSANELLLEVFSKKNMSLKNNYIEGIGDISNIIRELIKLPEKNTYAPIRIPDEDYYVIFQLDKKTNGYIKSRYAAMEEIIELLTNKKALDQIVIEAERYRTNLTGIKPYISKLYIDYDNTIFPTSFVHEVMQTHLNEATKVFLEKEKAYFAKVIYKEIKKDAPLYILIRDKLIIELQNMDKDKYFEEWVNQQRKKTKIKDKRPKNLR